MASTVSVIIPTYNHGDYVLDTLESVFAQTFIGYEIIVINDGSPDNTAQILLPLVEAGKIRCIEQENQGQAAARNRGLAEAKGEFIAFLDDDDTWPRDKLEWQVEFLQENSDYAAVGGFANIITKDGDLLGRHRFRDHLVNYYSLFVGNPFASPGQVLIKASILREVGGWHEDVWGTDDYDLWFRITKKFKFFYVSRLSLCYRWHESNASHNIERMMNNTLKVVEIHLEQSPYRMKRRFRRNAYRFVYDYLGKNIVKEFKLGFKERSLQKIMIFGRMMLIFGVASFTDHRIRLWLIRDALPSGVRQLVAKLKKE